MINKDFPDLIWKEFYFDEIFDVKKGFYNKKPEFSNSERIPFLGATANNNGITGFSSLEKIEKASKNGHGKNHSLKKKIFEGNCITVTNNGTSMGYAYYQKNEFTCSHDINPLYLKDHKLNKHIALFLIVLIEKQKICFEYSRKWRPERMKKSKILIPVTDEGIPDWDFMESYMKEKEKLSLIKYKKYLKNRLNHLKKDIVSLEEDLISKNWKEFKINDVLSDIQRGRRLKREDHIKGATPYVSASATNNGIDDCVSNKEKVRIFSKCLTLANSGTNAGACFYQPFEFVASDHVTKLANNNFNRHIYLFIGTVLSRLSEKYGFSREISDKRLKKEKIMLPIDDNDDPDWNFMESYMKKLEYDKISKYITYIENQIK